MRLLWMIVLLMSLTVKGWAQIQQLSIPPHTATYCCNGVRGYYFRAPVGFTITGLRVPNDYPQGSFPQSVAVVKFNNGAPPSYPLYTNDFVQLARITDQAGNNIIPVCIPVQANEWIGIYGDRMGYVTYGSSNHSASIFGMSVTLKQSGMNYSLQQHNMQEVWSQDDKIGRIEMYYTGAMPAMPDPIIGDPVVCAYDTKSYQTNNINGLTYQWSGLPNTATIVNGQGTNNIQVNWDNTPAGSYTMSVTACRTECPVCSPPRTLTVQVRRLPASDGQIVGSGLSCADDVTDYEYSQPAPPGVTYNWSIIPPNAGTFVNGNTGMQIGIRWNRVGVAQVVMTPSNMCGNGSSVTRTINVLARPPIQPSVILGDTVICPNPMAKIYRVNQEPEVTYTWSGLPTEARLISGQNTNQITVDWGNTPAGTYTLTVSPRSICGTGVARTQRITVKALPQTPANIFGNQTVCINPGVYTYNVPLTQGNRYEWRTGCSPVTITPMTPAGERVRIDFSRITAPVPFPCEISVKAVNECGQSQERSLTVTVIGTPTQPGNIQGGTNLCEGQVASYFIAPVPQATSYNWRVTPGGGHSFETPNGQLNVTFRWLVAGTYTLSVQALNPCGQSEMRTQTITVNPIPATPVLAQPVQPVCPGAMNVVYSVNGLPGMRYHWNVPDPFATIVSGQNTANLILNWSPTTPPGTYNITVQAFNGTCNSSPLTIPVEVGTDVSPAPRNLTGPTQICNDTSAIYQADPVPGVTEYLWENLPPNSFIESGFGTNRIQLRYINVPAGNYTITLRAVNACGRSEAARINVSVRRRPDAPVFTNTPSVFCVGQRYFLEVANDPNVSYQWSSDCIGTLTPVGNRASLTITAVQTCQVSVRAFNSCGTSSATVLTLNSENAPRLTVPISGETIVCAGRTETYRAQALPGYTYQWAGIPNGAMIVSGQGTPTLVLNWGNAPVGFYNLTVTPSNACGRGIAQLLRVEVRTVPAQPTPISGATTVCRNATETYSIVGAPNVTYQWTVSPSLPGFPINGSLVSINWSQVGTYVLSVNPINACGTGQPRTLTVSVTDRLQADAGQDQTICTNFLTITGTPAGGTWSCVVCTGGTRIVAQNNGTAVLDNIANGTHKLRYTITSGSCGTAFDEVEITNARPQTPLLTADQTFCGTANGSIQLNFPNPNGVIPQVLYWESSTDGLQWNSIPVSQTQLNFNGLTQTTMYRAVVNLPNRVCADVTSNTVTITVSSEVLAVPAESSITTCEPTTTLSIVNGVAGTWSFVSGPSLATVISTGTIGVVSGMDNEGIYLFRYTSSTPPCPERVTLVTVRKLTPVDPQTLVWSYDSTVCSSNTRINLSGVPNGAMVNWQFVSGPMPLNLSGDQSGADVSGMNIAGTYIIICVAGQPACNQPFITKQIKITRINPPTGQTFAPVQVCADSYTIRANVPTSGTGRWQFLGGVTTPTWTSQAETLNVTNMPQAGTYHFTWIISNPPCADVVSSFSLTKLDNTGQASVPQNFIEACTTAVTLTANPPNPGLTGSWSVVSGNASITTMGNNGFVSGMIQQGDYVFRWTVTGGSCGTSYADVTVRRNANIPMPNAGQPQMVCNATNAVLRGSSPPQGITARWRFVSGPVTPTMLPSGTMLIVSGMAQYGIYTFAWEFTSGNCAPMTSFVTVTRVAPPTVANIQPVGEICGNSFTLRGNQPTFGTGRWEIVSYPGGNPRIMPSGNNATVSDITVSGTYIIRYTIENPPCTPSFAEVAVTVNTGGSAGTLTANMTAVCSGNNTGTLSLSGYDGNIIRWESSPNVGFAVPTIINHTGQNYTFNNLTQTTFFRVVIKKQNCPEITSNIIRINVLPPLPQADAGPDVTICTNNVTLTGSNPGIYTPQWEFLAGGTTPTLTQSGSTVVITGMNVPGKYTFRYRISSANPNCGVSTDEVVVTVSAPTQAGTLSKDATFCSLTNSGTLTLAGYVGSIVRWEFAENANFSPLTTLSNQSDRHNYRNLTRTTWFRAVVKSGACAEATSNTVKISIINGTIANAGQNQSICANQTTLTGNLPQTGTPSWVFVSGPATPTLSVNANIAQVSGLTQEGTYVFEYRISNVGCPPSTDQVSVQVFGNGSAGTATVENATICSGQTARLRLSGQQGTILRWESSTDQWISVQSINTTTNDFTTAPIFTNTQYRAVVKNGVCPEQLSNSVLVTVEDANFTADAGPDQTLCANQVTLTGNVPPSGTPRWRCISGPNQNLPTVSVNGTVGTANNLVPGNYVFEYSVENRACGVTRDEVRVQILAPPSGTLNIQDTLYCGSATGTIRINNLSGNVIRWEVSTNNFATANWVQTSNDRFTFSALTRSTAFRALLFRAGCDSVYTNVIRIIVNPQPTAADAGPDRTVCGNSLSISGNVPQTGIPSWTLLSAPNGVVPIVAINGNVMTASNLSEGTYRFIYTVSSEPCQPSRDTVEVKVFTPANGGLLTANSNTLCAGNNNLNLTLSQYSGEIVRWETSPNNQDWQTIPETTPTPVFTNLTQTTYFRAVVKTVNCPESRSNVIGVVVLPNPVGGTLSGGGTFCRQNVSGTLNLSGFVGTIVRWEASTDDFVSNIQTINNTGAQLAFSNLTQRTAYRVVVQSGSCGTVLSSVAVVELVNNTEPGTLTGEQTVCSGENNGTLTLTGYSGTILRWESSTNNFLTVNSISNSTPQLIFNNLTQTTAYRVVVFNPGCPNVNSNAVTITVRPNTVGGIVNGSTTVCAVQNSGLLTLTGHSGNVVRWESSTDGTNWTSIQITVTSLQFQNLTVPTRFRAVVKNGDCPEKNATEAFISTDLPSQGGTLSGGQTVCAPSRMITLTLTGQRGNILFWESSTSCVNFSQPTSITNSLPTLTVTNLTQTTCYRVRVKNGVCEGSYSNPVTIQVQPLPVGGIITGDTAVCATNPSGILNLTGHNAPVIRWERKVGNGNWTTIGNTTNQLSFNNLTETTYYRVRVGNAGCSDTVSAVATVRLVTPSEGGLLSQNQTLCFGTNTAVLRLTNFQANSIQWQKSLDSLSWQPIQHALPDLILNNLDTTTFYRVRTQNGNCEPTYSNVVKVTVTIRLTLSVASVTGCNGRTNIQANATGGREPYQYSISPMVRPSNTNGKFNDLTAGRYVISVADANGCADTFAVVVGDRPSPPQVMDVINVTQTSALVRWVEVPPGTGVIYNLRYRVLNEPTWTLLTNLTNTYQLLSNLQNNTTYEVEVQYLCPNGSEWSPYSTQLVRRFTTLVMGTGDCLTSGPNNVPIPGGIYLSQITPTTVVVNWNLVDNAMGYIISYGIANENPNNWTQIIVCHPTTSLQLNNLSPNANYRVRLRTNCSNCITALNQSDKRSAWSQFFNFTTPSRREASIHTDEDIVVYPNPTKDILYVSGIETVTPYECFDAYGRRVGQGILTTEQPMIDLSDKTAGVYLLKMNGFFIKVIKE
jgi:hypothetical protein